MPSIKSIVNYGTPIGWASMGVNKLTGGKVDTYGDVVSDGVDTLSGKNGLETAAEGAREAQRQANALADLQWQRQMQGLGEARGQTQPYLSLLDRIYGTQLAGHQTPVSGGGGPTGPAPVNGVGHFGPPMGTFATNIPNKAINSLRDLWAEHQRTGQTVSPNAPPPMQAPPQQSSLEQLIARLRGGG